MLKQLGWKRKTLLILPIFLLMSLFIISTKTNLVFGHGGIGPPRLPTEVPATYRVNDRSTATPNDATVAIYRMTVYPTPTDIPISKYTDLSPNLKDEDKFIILVKRADGTYERFSVGPLRPETPFFFTELPDYILKEIPLQTGDEIIAWLPPANPYRAMGTARPTATQSTIFPTEIPPTAMPYPDP